MASIQRAMKPTFKQRWDEDWKWRLEVAIFTVPGTIAVIALGIVVLNLYTGWFFEV